MICGCGTWSGWRRGRRRLKTCAAPRGGSMAITAQRSLRRRRCCGCIGHWSGADDLWASDRIYRPLGVGGADRTAGVVVDFARYSSRADPAEVSRCGAAAWAERRGHGHGSHAVVAVASAYAGGGGCDCRAGGAGAESADAGGGQRAAVDPDGWELGVCTRLGCAARHGYGTAGRSGKRWACGGGAAVERAGAVVVLASGCVEVAHGGRGADGLGGGRSRDGRV
mmetsp:Transcript_20950/g.33580  ORF Transcript_20950/g.33580 Transcript_20950/m.33580 type:complete len:224 (-) Transcript_20950:13-684(-)